MVSTHSHTWEDSQGQVARTNIKIRYFERWSEISNNYNDQSFTYSLIDMFLCFCACVVVGIDAKFTYYVYHGGGKEFNM